ncbi:hypothetical protein GQ44DRAFT_616105 [Phaeosphaeriaceae sp. PMI808]|nr:hypothetical protein GQ44DRAFT_616105 [Phaeosphaeriaceae sp. PMI808]
MATNNRYYYSLPTEAPERSRSGSRRPPLTPSTVSSPCLTTLVSLPRRDSAGSSGSPTKAHAMLAKVVSSPATPRGETSTSPASSPTESRTVEYHSNATYSSERPTVSRTESDRYVRQYRQQDGYISFPDFEKFCQGQGQNHYEQHREHTAVRT